jgi:MFS family permease
VTRSRRIGCVLLPFAAGYYLSYLFRSINALIAADLTAELGLSAADLGLLTAIYFLVFAAAQIPCGILLDRHGPRTLLSGLLLLASAGALLFALADTLMSLLFARVLIGIGVALALMGGFKAIVLWFPAERLALTNGWFVMLGALGAVTATAPADLLIAAVGWRGLFAVLGGLSALAALLIVGVVPDEDRRPMPAKAAAPALSAVYRDRRFWRLAPLSSLAIGTSWSLQGLWAAPWLRDVDGLDRTGVVGVLSLMAIVVSASGLALGIAANHARRLGGKTEHVLFFSVALSLAAQLALLLELPVATSLAWGAIAAVGAATVLSYAILADYYPKEISGRANAALNLLHVGGAFALQALMGLIIEQWPVSGGHYPADAYKSALGLVLGFELVALAWFCLPAARQVRGQARGQAQGQAWVDLGATDLTLPVPGVVSLAARRAVGDNPIAASLASTPARVRRDDDDVSPERPSALLPLPPQSGAEHRAKTPAAGRPTRRTSATR